MKKIIIIVVIAVVAVLNFTLVASKSGNASLKSLTSLAKANACDETELYPVGSFRTLKGPSSNGSSLEQVHYHCSLCGYDFDGYIVRYYTSHTETLQCYGGAAPCYDWATISTKNVIDSQSYQKIYCPLNHALN